MTHARRPRAPRPSTRRRRGFTLPELLVAMTLLLLVGGGAVNMVLSTYRSLRSQREITTTEDALRILEQTINTVLRAAAANPMRITGSTLGVPRLEGITSTVASQCLGVRAISDLNADRVMTGPLEFVEIQHRSSDETIQFRSSSAGTAETAADLIKTLRFEFLTATGVAVNCATSMSTARHVRVTLEARRRAGSDQLITRQWLVHLRNFQ